MNNKKIILVIVGKNEIHKSHEFCSSAQDLEQKTFVLELSLRKIYLTITAKN
jgi:hypothetical protein